ncbi:hypothetical protein BN59_02484 [Legionella massiliensis]|uniref:Uncharacterized protein n=1 Tax=Legionella massiliensis TaxID=1034943 RepID=A0A078KZ09_9GAMM|nr:DUF5630 domain-containing protein [Legionella massiliensis]CDZ78176.1 hypothetical protein BN59_02484 [Legionella massiliensis]CEE13914.1 hypothetical protein BN1094_02484 [Legionella massiliensis]
MGGSYNDWLKPSETELREIATIERLIASNKLILAEAHLKRLPLDTLLRFTELNQTIKTYCDKAEQASIWRKHLEYFKEGDFSLQEQRTLSISQLVKGYYFYWLAVERREQETEHFGANELEFLHKSAEQRCFNAYNSLSTWAFDLYKEGSNDHFELFLKYAEEASKYHWTPGFLLVYKACLKTAALNNYPLSYYQLALEALVTARKLSEYSDSLMAQNNAYFGRGIVEGNNHQFTSWDKAIARTIAVSKLPISLGNDAYSKGSQRARLLISEFEDTIVDNLQSPHPRLM